jgi:cellulose biosynthesis protein BcsQ
MPLEGSYVIWNNRGGSGKTNLTYHLAIKYAYRNPDKTVLVIDMCPQADLSHAFLGKCRKKISNAERTSHVTHTHTIFFF